MNIILYTNNSENNRIGKDISEIATLTGYLREDTSITDPVIKFSNENVDHSEFMSANYMYIEEFNRYYFIKNIKLLIGSVYEIHAHVDVLESYADEIKALPCMVLRSTNMYNVMYKDEEVKMYSDRYIKDVLIDDSGDDVNIDFANPSYVMAIITGVVINDGEGGGG